MATSKYADHLPLNRQARILKRHGVDLSRSTLCGWMRRTADLVEPLYRRMCELVLQSAVIHTDDTPVPVLDKSREDTRKGRLWQYYGDEAHPHVVFDYTPNHSRDGPARFLAEYEGYLQADAFAGYDRIYTNGLVKEVACWAHARRKFFDVQTTMPAESAEILARIKQLYEVEEQARGLSPQARCELRQAQSRPRLMAIRAWLDEQSVQALPKSPLGQAVGYALSNWEALMQYTESGILAIDNNVAERVFRLIAIGRRNWLFTGSDRGGRTASILFSITATCQRHDIDPFLYLRDVLARLADLKPGELDQLLPDRWQAARAGSHPASSPSAR